MKKLFRKILVAATLSAALVPTGAVLAQEVTLKLAHFLPIQANIPKNVLEPWADKIEADSNGRIKIERFYGMALGGKPPELMDQVLDGVAEMAFTVTGYTPGRFPRSEAFELPFMMTNAEATSRAYWDYAEKHMFNADFKDYKILAVWVHGPGLIHSTDPIRVPSDLNGVKLRSPTRVTNMMFSELGATSVGMPVPAVPEALSKGVIDATVIPWEVTGALKVPELVSNHTEFGDASLYTTTFVLPINLDVWNGIPADLQKIIMDNSGPEFSAFGGGQMQRDDAPGRAEAVDLGNNIMTLSEEEVQQWRDAASGIEAKWIADMNSKDIDGAALVKEARELIKKYSGM
ncbi:MAG: TRAP transporter substrate-binding protein [Granulosicoccus sp.]|nr:TRAP transporter substrate-binding protein [Granulosicoccus sp.]